MKLMMTFNCIYISIIWALDTLLCQTWFPCLLYEMITHTYQLRLPSGGGSPVNWLSQTRRNLTNEHLNLNFVTKPKFIMLHSFYEEKVFISCVWLIPISRVRTTSKPFRYRYFKVFNQIRNRQNFQLIEKKNHLPENMQRKWLKVWELVVSQIRFVLYYNK